MSKAFLDTNVLVYQLDPRAPEKQVAARELVRDLAGQGDAVVSTQILQEFYVVSTGKLGVDPLLAKGILHTLKNMEIVTVDADLIDEAVDAGLQYQLSFWDSLVVVSAEAARCATLYSEDMNDGQVVRGVTIVNPFR